jgi:hypothetical protein
MAEPLITYLNDHLGGAQIAIELLESMRDQHEDQRFRDLANNLLPEIQADDRTLRSIAEKLGPAPSIAKQAGGWIVEKLARLELLVLGIHGKLCLWKALVVASQEDLRLQKYDFGELIRRAKQQYDQVENERLNLAQSALASGGER